MKIKLGKRAGLLCGLAAPLVVAVPQQSFALEDSIEEIVTTGTRARARSVEDSPAPVDVLSADYFTDQGDTDLSNLVRNIVPSYNVNTQPISDAATIVRPANLRGLAPDHTLVLINGKRRHRAAVIYWLGNGVADGAQGPDISAIPAIAMDITPVAASATTPTMMPSASGAFSVRGSSTLLSRIRNSVDCLSARSCSREPWTNRTSPGCSMTSWISSRGRQMSLPARCKAKTAS